MANFMLICEHPAEDCEPISREQQDLGTPVAIKDRDFFCSCPYGVHNGWVVVEGDDSESILASLPPLFRSHAQVLQIETVRFS
jgi:hypothetical protein